MRNTFLTLAAVGATPWVPVNWEQANFSLSVAVILSEDEGITYTVQHTFDPMGVDYWMPVKLARAAGVVTATTPYQHGLTAGDSVDIFGSGSTQMDSQPYPQQIGPPWTSGVNQPVSWTVATTPSPTTFTYAVTNAGPAADTGRASVQILRVFPNATLAALSARGFANYANQPITGIRLTASVYTAGFAQLEVIQGMGR